MAARVLAALSLVGAVSSRIARTRSDSRIVGGYVVSIDKVPWQVSVMLAINQAHWCGGSIIAASCVLTAAHCIFDEIDFQVRSGSSDWSGGTIHDISYIQKHEKYNKKPFDYDVAIIKITGTFKFGRSVQIVPLATEPPPPGATVTVSGWGATEENGKLSESLRAVQVAVVSRDECQTCYYTSAITGRMLCAGAKSGGRDACQGDSGGPLVYGKALVGVVSFGKGCAQPQYPGVYADVASLRDWIQSTAGIS